MTFIKKQGRRCVAAGAIKPDGFEAVAASQADHDDAIVSLTWSSELGGYAYFSPAVGLVRIDDDRLRRFKLDILWFLQWIASHLGFGAGARQVCLIPDRLLGSRGYLARRNKADAAQDRDLFSKAADRTGDGYANGGSPAHAFAPDPAK